MKFNMKKVVPHLLVVVSFIIIALAYFNPVLGGKVIFQNDIAQYTGMAKQLSDTRKIDREETYWIDNAFLGMPTYQLGAKYPHNYTKKLDLTLRFLPRPADYMFLYFIGIYILLLVFKVEYKFAFLGALAFGFSTYMIIILGVGHNAKAHAIAYMPLVLAGIFMAFQKKYIWGFLLTTIAMALEINANHFQMTYYLLLLVLVIGIVYLIDAYKKQEVPHFFKTVGILSVAVIMSLALNASNLMATQEYVKYSTRGKSELTINPDGTPKENTGLSKEYITEYSYGKIESLNLFVPGFMGGSSSESLDEGSNTYKFLIRNGLSRSQALDFVDGLPLYWGDQTYVGAPAYIGAVVIFLFILALFLVKGRLKWWLVAGSVITLILSWGKNSEYITNFFIDYVPLYNKFRAVSSIQVIIELCVPILAVFGLVRFFNGYVGKVEKLKALKWSTIIAGGVALAILLFKGSASFVGARDGDYLQIFGHELLKAIKEDRASLYTSDAIRTLIFVILTAGTLFFFLKNKLKENFALVIVGILLVADLIAVGQRYVNKDDFVSARRMELPFAPNAADKEIMKDKGHYRVFEPSLGMSNARTAFFHKTLGGYHAAKPAAIQDLYDFHIAKNNIGVLNMLNVKYIISEDDQRRPLALTNPDANGSAWFVQELTSVGSANEEIKALEAMDTKKTAVFNGSSFVDIQPKIFATDSLDSIELTSYKPQHLVYQSNTKNDGLAVFSEAYYAPGWNAYIDGNEVPYFRANYALRAMNIPAGKHTVEFKFEPKVVQTGSTISLVGSVLFILLLGGGIFYSAKNTSEVPSQPEA